ncbi:Peptidase family S49 [Albimonas donghaensis]|uniref:Peptidase family S49 n=1 Tax=Albimonas donghaensis TaxID=356660 RepID=A0A1H3FHH2_9RHOB|nr:S49 family peptidase [Albimonas donghaensis]SDX90197.1 Peptidase family S49 [Albimonas donghaensis]
MLTRNGSALARLCAGPLALSESALDWAEGRAARALALQEAGGAPQGVAWSDDAMSAAATGWRPYDMREGVALIPVQGIILPSFCLIGWDGATGCEQLRWQVETALADDQVQAIALMIDSPGGYVAGVDETASAIRAARGAKPVASIVMGHAFSAAFWLASAGDTISCPRTGGLGHIGVISLHMDVTGWLAAEGIKPTLFRSGAHKAEGHPLEPMTDAAAASVQAELDDLRGVFAEAVAEGRAGAIDVAGVLATEARAYLGPQSLEAARKLGLFDAILPSDQALALFVEGATAGAAG